MTPEGESVVDTGMPGIGPDEKVLLYAGAFEPGKRIGVLLDQFLEFRRTGAGRGWHFILAGEGKLEFELRRMASSEPNVHFLPPAVGDETLAALYRRADLTALVSRKEPGGETLRGAMASGCAVLATDGVGCASELIEPGKTGWCVDSAHPELWFDYPKAASKAKLKAMGEAAAIRAKTGEP